MFINLRKLENIFFFLYKYLLLKYGYILAMIFLSCIYMNIVTIYFGSQLNNSIKIINFSN